MKLSYRNYPVLQMFDRQRFKNVHFRCSPEMLGNISSEESRKNLPVVMDILQQTAQNGFFTKLPIYVVSSTFMKCFLDNQKKFDGLLDGQRCLDDFCENSCFIHGGMVVTLMKMSADLWGLTFFLPEGGVLLHEIFNYDFNTHSWKFSPGTKFFDSPIEDPLGEVRYMLNFMLFKKYAPVDIEVVGMMKKRVSSVSKEKTVNDTGIDVILLDSRWFRSIIRTEGFSVRGHFRLQPCKDSDGLWTRKLIYINEYEKHGYHRQAIVKDIVEVNSSNIE